MQGNTQSLGDRIVQYLVEISEGRCSIDDAAVLSESNSTMQEVMAGLLLLHDELRFKEQERMRFENELVAAKDLAEAASRAKSEFLSSMSHELRTPLNAILGFGQLLELDNSLNKDTKDSVAEIMVAGKHLLSLISDLLDLARIEAGKVELSLESVDVCELVREGLKLMKPSADGAGIRLQTFLDSASHAPVYVFADRVRLKQVLLNLLSNAVKYNSPQGLVDLTIMQGENTLRIAVRDTGPGIAPHLIERLFRSFDRLGAEGKAIEGTGIGLVITKNLVEMMHGTIEVESQLGVGSTFSVTIPLAHPPADLLVVPAKPSDIGRRFTVLYIEDNPSNIELMRHILQQRADCELYTAFSGEEGVTVAQALNPDLVLLDINLPNMNGYEVFKRLRQQDVTRDTPVLVVTANQKVESFDSASGAGVAACFSKPLDLAPFLHAVDQALSTRT